MAATFLLITLDLDHMESCWILGLGYGLKSGDRLPLQPPGQFTRLGVAKGHAKGCSFHPLGAFIFAKLTPGHFGSHG